MTTIGVADRTAVECARPAWAKEVMTIMTSVASRTPRRICSTGRVERAAALSPPGFRDASSMQKAPNAQYRIMVMKIGE